MDKARRQRIYNRVARHLLRQGVKSQEYTGACLYRGDGGLRCAIGALIPERLYREHVQEGLGVPDLPRSILLHICGGPLNPGDLDFLGDLQSVHDDNPPRYWGRELGTLAEDWGLSAAVVETTANQGKSPTAVEQ